MGSRVQEVRATAGPFVEAARLWLANNPCWEAQAVLSPVLPGPLAVWLKRKVLEAGVEPVMADPFSGAAPRMGAYGLALCASGTACLEAALAGAAPVIGYRCDRLSAFVAKMLLRTDHIGLPNIILGRRAFPELVQGDLRPQRVVEALSFLCDNRSARLACVEVRDRLRVDDNRSFGERVVRMLVDL